MNEEKYYLIDTRQAVGNCMLFWRKNNAGYTTKIEEAETYTKKKAQSLSKNRDTDVPISEKLVEELKRSTIDIQDYRKVIEP